MDDHKLLFKYPFYFLFPTLFIATILGLLLFSTINLEKSIEKKIFEISTSDVFSITNNSALLIRTLLKESSDYTADIKINPLLQHKIEENLKTLITPNIKYAYLLYRDSRGVFRFLGDASRYEEKALWIKNLMRIVPNGLIFMPKKRLLSYSTPYSNNSP